MSGKDTGDERDDDETDRDSDAPERASEPPERDSEPPDSEPESSRSDRARTLKSRSGAKVSKAAKQEAEKSEAAQRARQRSTMIAVGVGVVALAAGGAAGWFGHIEQGKAKIRAEAAAPAGSAAAASCDAWEKRVCSASGAQSLACQQAKGASSLLTTSACDAAFAAVPGTLAKVKAQRVPCDTLVSRLCKDLPPESQTCGMIKERTPLFPPEKCKEMLGNYEQVLNEVRQIDQQGAMPMGMHGGPHGADDGHGH
jgi:hypothetical protein